MSEDLGTSVSRKNDEMRVLKRNGTMEPMSFDKILHRIQQLGHHEFSINYHSLTIKVIDQLFDGISTQKIDEFTAEQCAALATEHPDYATLAARILLSNHQKNTNPSFFQVCKQLYEHKDADGNHSPIVSVDFFEFVAQYSAELEQMIDHTRDQLIDYFGFKTLERAYLFKCDGVIVERVQYMWLRVAVDIHRSSTMDIVKTLQYIQQTYDLMSTKHFTHATPTLFNAGTPHPQLSSCFLVAMEEDSIEGIYNTLKECAIISKWGGGIGLHIHNVRSQGSHIEGTNGSSNGIVPMLRVFNNTAKYVDQGGNKRNGSFAIYLEPWHADVESFLEMKKNHGDEEQKARDLFYALWIPDLFMERVKNDETWSLLCPNICKQLSDVYGQPFNDLYISYEKQPGKVVKTVRARDLWKQIMDAQMETGTPYLLYKDHANRKSNQQNLGTVKSSNLCCEIMEYSDKDETAVCNLASIGLPMCITNVTSDGKPIFDYDKLYKITQIVTYNLNRVIDVTFYPTEKCKRSNLRHRPIGIGVQGLADVFMMMDVAYHSEEAKEINRLIFETIYFAALEKSCEMAKETAPYESFYGSPASEGILQFDLWKQAPHTTRYPWEKLKQSIKKFGLRNSLLVAPMPTASTSQIFGFNECFEPFTSNIYNRRTLAGEFTVVNKHLIKELIELGKWNNDIKQNIIANKGSVQQLTFLSEHVRNKYKIVWEMPMKFMIDMAVERGRYICQSQSMNLWIEEPNYSILTSMHFYGWQNGLKTGIYYLRRKAKHQAQQFTVEPPTPVERKCTEDICELCSA